MIVPIENILKEHKHLLVPSALFFDERYKGISDTAKIMYIILFNTLDKAALYDEDGKPYQAIAIDEFMQVLNCTNTTVIKAKKALAAVGLITNEIHGGRKSNRFYIKDLTPKND